MATATHENELTNALSAFETALNTPLVPGEHVAWSESVSATWRDVAGEIRASVRKHKRVYAEMLEIDPELSAQVDKLREEDQGILEQLESLNEEVERMDRKTPIAEKNEARTDENRHRITESGISLVTRVRKQQVAANTWFMEAFNRDRGVGD